VQLTVSNNSATFPAGATMNQAGYIFIAAATDAPFNLDDVQTITWRIQALTTNAGFFVQPFLQTTPPEDAAYSGVFPASVALTPAAFPANTWVDVVLDVGAIGVVPSDAGADAGDIEVNNAVDAGDAGIVLTGFDKTYTRFIGLNVGALPTAPRGWVSVQVDSVTLQGTSNFPNKTFTTNVENLTLNMYQVPVGTVAPTFR
jgi:hypothetical protein